MSLSKRLSVLEAVFKQQYFESGTNWATCQNTEKSYVLFNISENCWMKRKSMCKSNYHFYSLKLNKTLRKCLRFKKAGTKWLRDFVFVNVFVLLVILILNLLSLINNFVTPINWVIYIRYYLLFNFELQLTLQQVDMTESQNAF